MRANRHSPNDRATKYSLWFIINQGHLCCYWLWIKINLIELIKTTTTQKNKNIARESQRMNDRTQSKMTRYTVTLGHKFSTLFVCLAVQVPIFFVRFVYIRGIACERKRKGSVWPADMCSTNVCGRILTVVFKQKCLNVYNDNFEMNKIDKNRQTKADILLFTLTQIACKCLYAIYWERHGKTNTLTFGAKRTLAPNVFNNKYQCKREKIKINKIYMNVFYSRQTMITTVWYHLVYVRANWWALFIESIENATHAIHNQMEDCALDNDNYNEKALRSLYHLSFSIFLTRLLGGNVW